MSPLDTKNQLPQLSNPEAQNILEQKSSFYQQLLKSLEDNKLSLDPQIEDVLKNKQFDPKDPNCTNNLLAELIESGTGRNISQIDPVSGKPTVLKESIYFLLAGFEASHNSSQQYRTLYLELSRALFGKINQLREEYGKQGFIGKISHRSRLKSELGIDIDDNNLWALTEIIHQAVQRMQSNPQQA